MNSFSKSLAFDGFLKIPQLASHRYCNFISDAISLTIADRSSPFFRDLDDHCPDSFLSDIWSSHFFSSFPQDYVPDCLPAFLSSVINTDHLILLQDTWFSRTISVLHLFLGIMTNLLRDRFFLSGSLSPMFP